MTNKLNRVLAFLLALIMMAGTFVGYMPAKAYADDAVSEGSEAKQFFGDIAKPRPEEGAEEKPEEEIKVEPEKTETPEISGDGYKIKGLPEGVQLKGVTPVDAASALGQKRLMAKGAAGVKGGNSSYAVDITFTDAEGNEIHEFEEPVEVTFTYPELSGEHFTLLHVTDKGNVPVEGAVVTSTSATFSSKSFSVYVVVPTGDDARLNVKFVGLNGAEVASMYVKKGDDMDQVLYDPGDGTPGDGIYFRGWTRDQNYTPSTAAKTIEDVRTEVTGMLPPATDGTEVTYYAMLFKDYRITYLDENEISLGQEEVTFRADSTSAEQAYTVNMGYTVPDDTHHFEGWNVMEGGSNISGHTDGKIYQNKDEITITGDVTFGVNAPEGHWFVFNENGQGATYNAPQFVYSSEKPTRPNDANMIRNGYTFGGWFASKAIADDLESTEDEYDFDQTLTDKVTVYARWIPKTTANYTILIWKQNLAGNGYDFEDSITLSGAVGSTVNTVSQQGSGDNAYARIDGTNYQYTGFHLKEFDQNITIKTEDNAVVNVYYDRTQYTLTFNAVSYTRVNNPSASDQNLYGYVDVGGIGYVKLTRSGGRWYFQYNGEWYRYSDYGNGNYYHQQQSTVKTITALYGQDISSNFPITGTNGTSYAGYVWEPQNSNVYTSGDVPSIEQMREENTTFIAKEYGQGNTAHMYYYTEAIGNEPAGTATVEYNGKTYVEHLHVQINVNDGVTSTETEDFIDIAGYAHNGSDPAYGSDGRVELDASNNRTIKFYYLRKNYSVKFLDGKYVDGNDNTLDAETMPEIHTESGILYGADISSLNSYKPDDAHTPAGFVFEGWYIDDACTQEYDFTTMPEGGITVYAKWRQKQYRVFLHPNYPEGATGNIDWGTANQAMNFRISEGGHVSEPTGRLTGFTFVGWYLDEACTNVFNGEAYTINESNVTTAYDKTVDMTDTYDNNGNLIDPKSNSDATGYNGGDRFWVTKKLDIYAKWRSTLDGASGIVVEYDANGGTGAPTDTHTYVDGAKAPAGAASKPAGSDKVFGYWVVQKWNGSSWQDTTTTVLPGDTFTVLAANAKVEDIENPSAGGDTKKYTVRLKAVYIDSEEPTPTHIYWYKNDGTDAFRKDTDLAINEAVNIPAAPTRDGYTFKGWARIDIGNTLDVATEWEADSANWTQDLTAPNLLFYNEADAKYYREAGFTNQATQVAADEDTPYQAMFAVWEENEVTINYAVASDSTGMGTVAPASETVKVATGNATGSTATPASTTYAFDYWTVDDGTESISTDAEFVPSKNSSGLYEAHTYYAHFKLSKATVTVHHYLKDTTTKVAEDETHSEVIGSEYTATPVTTYQEKNLTVNNYDPSQTVTVNENGNVITIYYTLPLTITANPQTYVYNGSPQGEDGATPYTSAEDIASKVTVDGLLEGDSLSSVTLNGQETNAGTYPGKLVASAATMNENKGYYSIQYVPGTLEITKATVTVTAENKTKVYGDADPELTATVTGLKNGDAASVISYTLSRAEGEDVGTYAITPAGEAVQGNYNVTYVPGTLEITKATVTVTAEDKTKVYGDADPELTATVTGLKNGDAESVISYTLSRAEGEDVGEYAITPAGEAVQGNYNVVYETGKLTITKAGALTVTVNNYTGVYDGAAHTVTATPSVTDGTKLYYSEDGENWTETTPTYTDVTKNPVTVYVKAENPNYETATGSGTVTITKAKITLTGSDSLVYNGAEQKLELSASDATGVVSGETLGFQRTPTVKGTNVGIYDEVDYGTWYVTKANDDDSTGNYTIEVTGTLTITKSPLKITADSASKEYDGTALTDDGWNDTAPEGLKGTDAIESVTVSGTITEVGTKANVASGAVVKNGNTDVTANYDITYVDGTLTVTASSKALVITSSTKSWTYDGETHTDEVYTVTYDGAAATADATGKVFTLSTGDKVTITATAAGVKDYDASYSKNNTYTYAISNAGSYSDVTANVGTLSINKAAVTLTSGSKTREYNGSALTNEEVEGKNENGLTVETGWVGSEGATYSFTGTITTAGTVKNAFSYTLKEGTLAENYTITKTEGDLTIEASTKALSVASADGSWTYDGETHTNKTYTVTFGSDTITGTEGQTTFTLSTGDTLTVVPTEKGANGVKNVSDSGANSFTWSITNEANYTKGTDTVGSLSVTPATLTVTTPDAEKEYDGTALTAEGTITGFVNGETATFTTTGNQTAVGSSENSYSLTWDGTAISTDYTVSEDLGTLEVKKSTKELKVASADGSWTYDGSAHTNKTYTVTYGTEKIEGTKGQTEFTLSTGDKVTVTPAAAATITHVAETTVDNAFTWTVENSDYYTKGTDTVGKLSVTAATLTVTTPDAEKEYDGTALTAEGTITGFVNGETATFATTGSQTEVGKSDNTYTLVFDKTAVESDYTVSEDIGELEVKKSTKELKVASADGSWTYDGSAHTNKTYTVTFGDETIEGTEGQTEFTLSTGDKVTVTPATTATITHVAETTVDNAFTWTVENESYYTKGTDTVGKLSVTPATLTVTTPDAEKEYDGTALTAEGTITGFVNNETATFATTGSQTEVGKSDNTYTLVFDKTAVESDYTVSATIGELEVKKSTKELSVASADGSWTYDGSAHTNKTYTVTYGTEKIEGTEGQTEFTLSTGDKVTVTPAATATITHVAETTVDNAFTWTVENESYYTKGTDTVGKLSVTKATLTVTTPDAEKEYDGTALTAEGTITGFVNGETATFATTGSQTAVGKSNNTYTLVFDKTAVESDYTVSATIGELEVKKSTKELSVASADGSWTYDGSAHTNKTYTVTFGDETIEGTEGQTEFTLSTGDKVTVTPAAAATITNVAESDVDNAFTWTVENEEFFTKGEDTVGKLTIEAAELTIAMADRTLVYNGETQTGWNRTDEGKETVTGLVKDEVVTITYTPSSGENAGTYENGAYDTDTLSIKDGETDVTSNYTLKSATAGKLTITPVTEKVTVTITGKTGTEKYDGTEKSVEGYTVSIDNELYKESDIKFSGDATVKETDAGTYNMGLTADDFENTSKNFENVEFVITDGTLEIGKRTVTLTSADDSKVYDGTALTNDTVTVGGDGFASGEGATYEVTGTQTIPGSSENAFTYTLNEGTKADNYDITTVPGTLTVSGRNYTITYDPNGGIWPDGTTTYKQDTYAYNEIAIIRNAPKRPGYTFIRWQGSTYQPGEQYHEKDANGMFVDDTLVAVWSKNINPYIAKTGDSNTTMTWGALSGTSFLGALGLFLAKKKRRKEEAEA
ncbi:MAG: InlB B-repeat-containing protein [Oscillospiraceae bacterium]|nr:InlB B-repeat-containing protein [Oscillospiraceae bacterium]